MRHVLVVVDVQNDFVNGSLGTKEAEAIIQPVVDLIGQYADGDVFATRDTHTEDYMNTQEGRKLPVMHCVKDTEGWQIEPHVAAALEAKHAVVVDKPSFGSLELAGRLTQIYEQEKGELTVTLVGLCTDICVVSNALLLKAYLPEAKLEVAAGCCAGVTPEFHENALNVMRSCQVEVR